MKITIYHNNRCGKSRDALNLLKEKGFEPIVIDYLKNPPKHAELSALLKLLNLKPSEVIRKKETVYKELVQTKPNLTDKELIEIICENPILLERPIIVANKKAVIARPTELLLDII